MSGSAPGTSTGDHAPTTRPLPSRPSLELERKHAKLLLRQLRAGESHAVSRARVAIGSPRHSAAPTFKLADAQLTIAREYGFLSWPRLVQYFGDVSRQAPRSAGDLRNRDVYEREARVLIAHHRNRRPLAGRSLAASIPRFYGRTIEEVFASAIEDDDARLTIAREQGCPSWDVLLERVVLEQARRTARSNGVGDPFRRAAAAIDEGSHEALRQIVADHPSLLEPPNEAPSYGHTLVGIALWAEQRRARDATNDSPNQAPSTPADGRAITDWLGARTSGVARAATQLLCEGMFLSTAQVRFLLERGADPSWVAPNGISVLEHALLLYWNGEAVDLIAARAPAPDAALWIAAGLGDVAGVSSFLDRHGKPAAAAHRRRPDFGAVRGPHRGMLRHPVADDIDVLLEAFYVAMFNDRIEVLDYLIDRGFPIDYIGWNMPFVSLAAGNQRLRVVECLVRRGANLDLRGRHPDVTAREMARQRFAGTPNDPVAARILELCSRRQ